MNEKKRAIITVTVIGVLLFVLIVVGVIKTESRTLKPTENENNVTSEYNGKYSTDYVEAFSGEGKKVLYIGSSSCSVCSEFTPQIKYLSEAYDFMYYYVDAASMNTEELNELLEKVGADIDNFGTPYVAFLENGEKIDEIPGYITESSLFDELQKQGIIGSEETYVSSGNSTKETTSEAEKYPNVSFINYSQYEEIYESEEKAIVVLGQTGCGACAAYLPNINEIGEEKNIKIYYVDMTQLESEDSSKITSLSYFKDKESWGTPLTLILENKEVVDSQEGAATKEVTLEFFQKNGFGK